jgi:hypothetical protein
VGRLGQLSRIGGAQDTSDGENSDVVHPVPRVSAARSHDTEALTPNVLTHENQ